MDWREGDGGCQKPRAVGWAGKPKPARCFFWAHCFSFCFVHPSIIDTPPPPLPLHPLLVPTLETPLLHGRQGDPKPRGDGQLWPPPPFYLIKQNGDHFIDFFLLLVACFCLSSSCCFPLLCELHPVFIFSCHLAILKFAEKEISSTGPCLCRLARVGAGWRSDEGRISRFKMGHGQSGLVVGSSKQG